MKKTFIIVVCAGLLFAMGCAKLKSLTNININLPAYEGDINIPAIYDTTRVPFPTSGIYLTLPQQAVPTMSQQYISQYNTTSDKITSISISSATLQMVNPSGANFNYLDSISVYLSAPNLPTILLATKMSVPKGQNILNLDVPVDSSLKSYFLKDTIYLQAKAGFNNVPPASSDIKSKITFHMVANPLN
jgi:hypothetical protein